MIQLSLWNPVRIHGLVKSPGYNGCVGIILKINEATGRFGVRVSKKLELVGIKKQNLDVKTKKTVKS